MAESAPAAAAADRLSYNVKTKKSIQGAGELLDALAGNTLKREEIEQKNLPPELQKLSRADLDKRIAKARDERAVLQKEIETVSKNRAAYIAEETKKLAAAGKGDSFDEKVSGTIRKQAEKKGIHY